MKKIIILFTIFLTFSSVAQITLEHSHGNSSQFTDLAYLSSSQEKYYNFDNTNSKITFYNLNHSIFKTVTFNRSTLGLTGYDHDAYNTIFYVSDNLFDNDNDIEFILLSSGWDSTYTNFKRVIVTMDEDGVIQENFGDKVPPYDYTYDQHIEFIKMTSNGTKLFLASNDSNFIYSLPGKIECVPCDNNSTSPIIQNTEGNGGTILEHPYPNPSLNQIKLPYSLPTGTNQAKLKIYNTTGHLIETLIIDHAFDHVLLDVTSYQQGSYIYKIEANGIVSNTKTFIKTN